MGKSYRRTSLADRYVLFERLPIRTVKRQFQFSHAENEMHKHIYHTTNIGETRLFTRHDTANFRIVRIYLVRDIIPLVKHQSMDRYGDMSVTVCSIPKCSVLLDIMYRETFHQFDGFRINLNMNGCRKILFNLYYEGVIELEVLCNSILILRFV